MARASSFKKGGGFLNNVTGKIVDYEFTDDMITAEGRVPFKAGKVKGNDGKVKDRFHSLNLILSAQADGADEPVTTTLFGGDADAFEISDDGKTVTPVVEGGMIGENTGVAKFIQSWEKASGQGAEEDIEGAFNYTPIIGSRVMFVQEEDAEAKRKGLKRKAKNGKEYAITNLVVTEVFETEEQKPAGAKGSAKSGSKPAAAPVKGATKGKPAPAPEPEDDEVNTEAVAEEALARYIQASKDGKIVRDKLRMRALTDETFKDDTDLRDAVIGHLFDDDWLEGRDGVKFSRKDKSKTVSLDA